MSTALTEGVLRLGRALPRAVAEPAARALGRAWHGIARRRRRAARERLAAVLPELAPAEARRVARRSFEHAAEAALASAAWPRRDLVAACHDLELAGWDRLAPPEQAGTALAGTGLLALCAPAEAAGLAAWALAVYRGPLDLLSRPGHPSAWRLAAAGLARHRGAGLVADEAHARDRLAAGGRLAVPLAGPLAGPHGGSTEAGPAATLFGRPSRLAAEAAGLAATTGAIAVALFVARTDAGWRISVAPPPAPASGPDELARAALAAVEAAARRRPAAWPWLRDPWLRDPGEGA